METDLFLKKVPAEVKELISREADLHRRSINQEAIVLLEEALAARLRTARTPRHEVREILAHYRSLPIRDNRGPEELVEYDEFGLPK
ncbi:MAG: Arc family DNA-binding protein [Burkholderiaceae bacterium]|jgi:hypothetical protein|nr:Arc family DNA-binding protein [Burkholderiaceae bacterium]